MRSRMRTPRRMFYTSYNFSFAHFPNSVVAEMEKFFRWGTAMVLEEKGTKSRSVKEDCWNEIIRVNKIVRRREERIVGADTE